MQWVGGTNEPLVQQIITDIGCFLLFYFERCLVCCQSLWFYFLCFVLTSVTCVSFVIPAYDCSRRRFSVTVYK